MNDLCEHLNFEIDELYKNIMPSKDKLYKNIIPSKEELDKGLYKYKEDDKKHKEDIEKRREIKNKNDCNYMIKLFNKTLIESLNDKKRKIITHIKTENVSYFDKTNHINYMYNLYPKYCIKYKEYKEYMDDLAERDIKIDILNNYDKSQITYELETKILTIWVKNNPPMPSRNWD